MGGIHSKYYGDFKDYCAKSYNCLRRHTSIIYVQLSLLYTLNPKITNNSFSNEYVKTQIIERFMPWESYEDAEFQFRYKIDANSNCYAGNIIDYFHKKCKNSNSLSNSHSDNSDTIYESALQAWDATSILTYNIGSNLKSLIWKKK